MSDYIMELRALVGHRPLLQCGASVIVENAAGEVLLQRRVDNGLWGLCGGSIEPDERTEDAAARELLEEAGLTARSLQLFRVFSGPELHYVYPNGDEVSNIDVVYLCREWSGVLTPQPGEVAELRFFPPQALPAGLSPPMVPVLNAWQATQRR